MATFGEEMVEFAPEVIEELFEGTGLSTIKRLTGQAYDPDVGSNVPAYSPETALMAFTEITAEEVQNVDYLKEHQKCIIAGSDLTFTPKKNDLIVKPSTTTHRVVHVSHDEFHAAYILHIERKNT